MISSRTIEKCIVWSTALLFFVPLLLLSEQFIFPFIVPKVLVLRSLVVCLTVFYIVLLLSDWQRFRPRFRVIDIFVYLFFFSFAFSTFFGIDSYASFWDKHERMLGLFTIAHYVLLYMVLSHTITNKREWRLLFRVFLVAGASVFVLAVIQRFIDPEFLLNRGAKRVSATLGNPIYLSGYGLFLFFLGLFLFFTESVKKSFWGYYALAGALCGFFAIFLGGTRGTLLGLLCGGIIGALLFGLYTKNKKRKKQILALFLIGFFALLGSWYFRDTNFVQNIPAVGRLVQIDLQGSTGQTTRLMAWGVAWEAFLEKPVFGWGPNNYFYAFNTYYRPEFLRFGYGETWFDNAHNVVMNMLATQGLFGLLSYVSLFGFAIFGLWRGYRKSFFSLAEMAILISFLVGHFVHNLFVFENPTSYLYFFVFLAYMQVRMHHGQLSEESTSSGQTSLAKLAVVSLVGVGIIFLTNVRPAQANMQALDTLRLFHQGQINLDRVADVFSFPTPHIDDVRSDVSRAVSNVVPRFVQEKNGKDVLPLVDLAIEGLQKNAQLHPLDIRNNILLSQLYQQKGFIEEDVNAVLLSINELEKARLHSPKRQQVLFMLAQYYTVLNDIAKEEEILRLARDYDPLVGESWVRLVQQRLRHDDVAQAKNLATEALGTENIFLNDEEKAYLEQTLQR